ncbi:MAG: DHHA1 domain-containing protein, partial [Cetobacterium sp.]
EEFLEKMQEQREKARSARTVIMEKGQDSFIEEFYDKYGKTEFTGYTDLMTSANLLSVRELEENRYALIFDKTPFYAESGGQESDNGIVEGEKLVAKVVGIQKQKEIYTHIVEVETGVEELTEGALLSLTVDPVRREEIAKNHTATHLLHQALKDVLGSHVQQAGSSCGADRLRFDFNHYEGLTSEELEKVEKAVNERIFMSTAVNADVMSMDEAKAKGATALFGDKYGNEVRVVTIGDYSMELCGGTHINNISKIGMFKIVSEAGVAAGVRRIEAQTSYKAYLAVFEMEKTMKKVAKNLKTDLNKIEERSEKIVEEVRELSKEIEILKAKVATFEASSLFEEVEEINGVKVLVKDFKDKDADSLREIVDKAKDKLGSCIIVLGSNNDKAVFAVGVTKDLISKAKAGDLVREAAKIADGNGGGRPDFAQAGGKNGAKVKEALSAVKEILVNTL